jgi:hypothetical protein
MDITRKSWVNHIIIAGGIIVAGFIIIGFFNTIRIFTTPTSSEIQATCTDCIFLDDNNSQRVVRSGGEIIMELPARDYPVEDLELITYPPEIVLVTQSTKSSVTRNWARVLQLRAPGTAEIIVPSAKSTLPDFHISLIIE